MKTLKTYFEELATPANTMGMGNPGEIAPDVLSEPIHTAKAEVEKDKKKRKKKIKDLSESLFDDNIKKELLIGDVLEIDEWDDFGKYGIGMIYRWIGNNDVFEKHVQKIINKPSWKKFLQPFASYYNNRNRNKSTFMNITYNYYSALWYFTWVVMCCKSAKEIEKKLKEFVDECMLSKSEIPGVDVSVLTGVGDMEELPRLVLIKFKINGPDSQEALVGLALKIKE